ncbi:hypothetical protein RUM43_004209 [Polyplax serrata]|uniref:PNPLA domain-containing protein n=1 Tax=Polyplax serrata TaxID=468196 RepID=A0AAN8SAP7_POLSC
MSVNQWKMMNYLRDHLAKTVSDKTAAISSLNKEWMGAVKKLPVLAGNIAADIEDSTKKISLTFQKSISNSEIPKSFSDLKLKLTQKPGVTSDDKSTWKTKKNIVSNQSITAMTDCLLNSITNAESDDSRNERLEGLIEHFNTYPDAIGPAIKNGAISKLLKIRNRIENTTTKQIISEVLATLGYLNPLPGQGIRILAIDGGGIRGLLVTEMLAKLEELTGKKINELFDYICGVSTGSVIACAVGARGKSIEEISALYRDLSNRIFTQNVFFGARSLVWNHGYYDTALWEELLKEHVGEMSLISTSRNQPYPKIGMISTVTSHNQIVPYIFRNYELPYRVKSKYLGSYKHKLWEAIRASAAAPTYFEEFHLGEYLHQDGGVLVNNPTAVAVHEAKQLWPDSPIQCVVSFGTGRLEPVRLESSDSKKVVTKQTSWKEKFYNILVSATDTEAVHMILNDLLPPSVYFRFNPFLTELLSMDECQPEKLDLLKKDALMYIRRNEEKFQDAAAALLLQRTLYQKMNDWVNEKCVEYSNRYN